MKLTVCKDLDELSSKAADEFVRIAEESISERGRLTVALSGGSTPKALYQKIANVDLDWTKIFFFFGDERNVPGDDIQSNYNLAKTELFEKLPISEWNVAAWPTEISSPKDVARTYELMLEISDESSLEHDQLPRFDLVLLGMGPDGHTASLFPHTRALIEAERMAVANWVPQLDTWRYTLTFPVINNARNIMFLVAGGDKSSTVKSVIEGDAIPMELPAQSVDPVDGELFWFLDEAAAAELSL